MYLLNSISLLPYRLGIMSKIGGSGDTCFTSFEVFIFDGQFWQEGIVKLKNSLNEEDFMLLYFQVAMQDCTGATTHESVKNPKGMF